MESCPACGRPVPSCIGRGRESGVVGHVVGWHTTRSGLDCWLIGYEWETARDICRIRDEGGDRLRLAAHP